MNANINVKSVPCIKQALYNTLVSVDLYSLCLHSEILSIQWSISSKLNTCKFNSSKSTSKAIIKTNNPVTDTDSL